jgi:outer membrane protein
MKHLPIIACAALLAWPSLPALAAPLRDAPKEKEWDVTLGAGVSLRPTFEGSDRSTVHPLPVFSVKWRDTITLGEGGLSAQWHHKRFRIGAGLTFDPGRKDHSSGGIFESGDDRLKGLGTVNAALGIRGFASYRLGPVNFEVSATKYTGSQNDGVLASLGATMPLPLTKRLIIMPHVRASWASGDTMQTYFGVTAAQSAASIFPRFTAGSGLRDVRGGVNIIYQLSPHWFMAADTSVTRLLGDAAKSPISIDDTNVMVTGMVGYRF